MRFVESLKYAKAHPAQLFASGLSSWWPTTGAEIMEQFRHRMNQWINHSAGEDWRNEETPEEIDMRRDERDLHNWLQNRIVCERLRVPSLQKRFGHLLWKED